MRPLSRKLVRELWLLKGQLIAIIVVIACGIANFTAFRSVGQSLILTRQSFYDQSKFPDVFVAARRVPESITARLERIPGVAVVQTRITQDVLLDLPGTVEPASGTIISIPDHGQPALSRLYLRSGRWVRERADNEVIISSAFADAHRFREGSQFKALINGRQRLLTVVAVAINPEYVIEMPPGTMILDNKRYGTMYMARSVMEAATDMKGAFNSAAIKLEPGANEREVIAKIDLALKAYGTTGANGRNDQLSHRFLSDEIAQVQVQAVIIPTIFLGVAIFLLNIALLRLVSTQRMTIAILKAFGYSNTDVALHYIGFALVAVASGAILGMLGGEWIGRWLTEVYARFYRFPVLRFDIPEGVVLGSVILSACASILGALSAVRNVVALPPAEAMRPAAPRSYKPLFLDRVPFLRRLDPVTTMMWRTIERRPAKSILSILMIGLAMAIMVIGRSMFDMFDVILDMQFNRANRQDVSVNFYQPRSAKATFEVRALPGVLRVEPYRIVPIDVQYGQHTKRLLLTSVMPGHDLVQVVHSDGTVAKMPPRGIVLTGYLADKFGLQVGDTLAISLLEGSRRTVRIPFGGRADEMFGLQAYMHANALEEILDEEGSVSGVHVLLDPDYDAAFSSAVKTIPSSAGVLHRRTTRQSFDDNYKENMDISTYYIVAFAVIIAFGVVYNSARIALSERATELAQLRILGFTLGEITVILVGEQLMLTLLAIPVGAAIGGLVISMLPAALSNDLFRFPTVLSVKNVGLGAATIVTVALISGFLIWLRLRRLDLISVLKSRE